MTGIRWSELDKLILAYYDAKGWSHEEIRSFLSERGTCRRTIDSIRSSLVHLKKDPTLYNVQWDSWNEIAIDLRIQLLPDADQTHFVGDNRQTRKCACSF